MWPLLLVDDEQQCLDSLQAMLRRRYHVFTAGPAAAVSEALSLWERHPELQLAIVDLDMPGATNRPEFAGIALIRRLKAIRPKSRVAVCSGYQRHEHFAEAASLGADGFFGKDATYDHTLAQVNLLGHWVALGESIRSLVSSDIRFNYLAKHGERVRDLCRALTIHLEEAKPNTFDLVACLVAAEIHDLGQLGIPDDPRVHCGPGIDKVVRLVAAHHQDYDENSPVETRVLQLADAWDNYLTGPQCFSFADAHDFVRQQAGTRFCPQVVEALELLLNEDHERVLQIYPPDDIANFSQLTFSFYDERSAGQFQAVQNLLAHPVSNLQEANAASRAIG